MKSQIMGLRVASGLFMAMALVHASRLVFHWTVQVGGWDVGLWPSVAVAVVLCALSIWLGSLACCREPGAGPTPRG
ncbi:MAG TPA: hypothetical protein VN877_04230 [Opitutaceae bacterium]|nr:hypothetical protein [Opitutaceae bacterium]